MAHCWTTFAQCCSCWTDCCRIGGGCIARFGSAGIGNLVDRIVSSFEGASATVIAGYPFYRIAGTACGVRIVDCICSFVGSSCAYSLDAILDACY